jgi:ATP phosphoribosyltransferase
LQAAGLGIVETIMDTQTVLISNPHAGHPDLVRKITKRFAGYMTATKFCMLSYNISRELLDQVIAVRPAPNRSGSAQQ